MAYMDIQIPNKARPTERTDLEKFLRDYGIKHFGNEYALLESEHYINIRRDIWNAAMITIRNIVTLGMLSGKTIEEILADIDAKKKETAV